MIENKGFISSKFKEIAYKYLSNQINGQVIKKSVLNNTCVSFAEKKEEVIVKNDKINHKKFGLCEIVSTDPKFTTLKLTSGEIRKVITKFI